MPPVDPEAKISCPTPQHLQAELESLADVLALGEKEETWDKMEKALIRFAGVTRGGGYKHLSLFIEGMGRKGCASKVAECMLSDRGRLSTAAVELLQAFAPRLGSNFAPIVQPYFEPLLKLFARPNKVFLKRSDRCLTKIIENCQLPNIVLELRKGLADDAATCRRHCSAGIERAINLWDLQVWTEKSLVCLEESLRRMATDKDAEVRQTGKRVWAMFTEYWPERVDEFSAPLTPTIRRYLNLPANGGPIKPKAKSISHAPPVRHAPAASSSSATTAVSSTKEVAATKAQSVRVAALVHKSSRAALRPIPPPVAVADLEPRHAAQSRPLPKQPSPTKVTPRKPKRPGPPKPDHALGSAPGLMPSRPDVAPLLPFRSTSHTVLPTVSSSSSLSEQNLLTRPHRPILPSSFSTTALFSEYAPPMYTSRFPSGPVRIVRPPPTPIIDDQEARPQSYMLQSNDGFPFTPVGTTVYGGPSRPPPRLQADIGHDRRPVGIGAAQRRIVTAPSDVPGGLGMPMKTPAATRLLAKSVRGKDKESAFSSPGRVGQEPRTPAPSLARRPVSTTPTAPVPMPATIEAEVDEREDLSVPQDEPAEHQPVEEREELTMTREQSEELRAMDGPIPVEIASQIPLPSDEAAIGIKEDVGTEPSDAVDSDKEERDTGLPVVETVEEREGAVVSTSLATGAQDVDSATTSRTDNAEAHVVEPTTTVTTPTTPVHALIIPLEQAAPETIPTTVEQSEATATVPNATSAQMVPTADTPPPVPKPVAVAPSKYTVKESRPTAKSAPTTAPPRKPPVPRAADLSRAPRPIDRKPFRPTTAAQTAAALAKSRDAAKFSAAAAKAAAAAPPPELAAKQARQVSASTSTSTSAQAVAPAPVSRPTKPSTLLAPTKASIMRAASHTVPKTSTSSGISTAASTSTSTASALPPVRKEKIRLKPALPSFRPVRSGAAAAASSTRSGMTATARSGPASTVSASTSSTAIRRVAVAKVKPESIPLPRSPAEKINPLSARVVTSSPLSRVGSAVNKGIRPDRVVLPASPGEEASSSRGQAQSIPLPPSPLAVIQKGASIPGTENGVGEAKPVLQAPASIPLPSSPVEREASASASARSTASAIEALRATQSPSPVTVLPLDRSKSIPSRGSNAPTMSNVDSDSESDGEGDDVDDLTGVTFKVRSDSSTNISQSARKPTQAKIVQSEDMNMSMNRVSPALDKLMGSTTPKYTPGRKALVSRDANVRSPLVRLASTNREEEDDDW